MQIHADPDPQPRKTQEYRYFFFLPIKVPFGVRVASVLHWRARANKTDKATHKIEVSNNKKTAVMGGGHIKGQQRTHAQKKGQPM